MKKKIFKLLIFVFSTIIIQSCDIQKKAIKTKTATTEAKDKTTTTTQNTIDYTKTNLFTEDLFFEPINPLLTMQIVTSKGDTIKSVNTKISNRKTQTDTYNNKKSEVEKVTEDKGVVETNTKEKESEKKEDFDSSFILYIVLGIVVLGSVLGSLALFLLYKSINKNSDTLKMVIEKIS